MRLSPTCAFSSSAPFRETYDAVLSLKLLDGTKKLDLFECARVPKDRPIEEVMTVLSQFVKEGHFDFIGLSESVIPDNLFVLWLMRGCQMQRRYHPTRSRHPPRCYGRSRVQPFLARN